MSPVRGTRYAFPIQSKDRNWFSNEIPAHYDDLNRETATNEGFESQRPRVNKHWEQHAWNRFGTARQPLIGMFAPIMGMAPLT